MINRSTFLFLLLAEFCCPDFFSPVPPPTFKFGLIQVFPDLNVALQRQDQRSNFTHRGRTGRDKMAAHWIPALYDISEDQLWERYLEGDTILTKIGSGWDRVGIGKAPPSRHCVEIEATVLKIWDKTTNRENWGESWLTPTFRLWIGESQNFLNFPNFYWWLRWSRLLDLEQNVGIEGPLQIPILIFCRDWGAPSQSISPKPGEE